MEQLTKKATILFPPDLYYQLTRLAKQRETSVGELVRNACRNSYSLRTTENRVAAVKELAAMNLPAADMREMESQSVPAVEPAP